MGTQSSPATVLPARMLHVPSPAALLAAKGGHRTEVTHVEGNSWHNWQTSRVVCYMVHSHLVS
jgi:hypothetical protein